METSDNTCPKCSNTSLVSIIHPYGFVMGYSCFCGFERYFGDPPPLPDPRTGPRDQYNKDGKRTKKEGRYDKPTEPQPECILRMPRQGYRE